mgnify:FL=1
MNHIRKKISTVKLCVLTGVLVLSLFNVVFSSQTVNAASVKTSTGVRNWLNAVKNKQVKAVGGFGGECVDLARAYSQRFVGKDIGRASISGGAKDYARQAVPAGYVRINYKKGVTARTGDIVIWVKDGGGYGHMAVVYSVTGNNMVIYEQNYAGKRYVISNVVRNYDRIYKGTGGQVTAILRPTNISS